jgi:membrane-anchored mycosin MYCP
MTYGARIRRGGARLACVAVAASLGTLLPAIPATAQLDSDREEPAYVPTPPKVNLGIPVASQSLAPQPGVTRSNKGCVSDLLDESKFVLKNIPWGQRRLAIDQIHALGLRGEGMTVAVIDTGINRHRFLPRLTAGADFVQVTGKGPGLEDCDGHGTEVAGIIAGDTTSDIGFRGVAPKSSIVSIRQSSEIYEVTNENTGNKDSAGNIETLGRAIRFAAERDDVDVINISIDNCQPASATLDTTVQTLQRTLHYAVYERDKVIVNSAGNTGNTCKDPTNGPNPYRPTQIVLPAWFSDYVLSVAAVKENGDLAEFSVQGPWVSVAAPGTDIISLDPASGNLANLTIINGQPQTIQGTSFAAPYVAGVATLIRQRFPNLSAPQVMERIKFTAQHPATPSGRDNLVGYGMVNPVAALTAMVPSEEGIDRAKAQILPPDSPVVPIKNWTPMKVALIGSGGGLTLLIITLFTMHTIRRNRTLREAAAQAKSTRSRSV